MVRVSTRPGDISNCSICGKPAHGRHVERNGRRVYVMQHGYGPADPRGVAEVVRAAAVPRPSAAPACPDCGGATFVDEHAAVGEDMRPAVVRFCSACEFSKEVAL